MFLALFLRVRYYSFPQEDFPSLLLLSACWWADRYHQDWFGYFRSTHHGPCARLLRLAQHQREGCPACVGVPRSPGSRDANCVVGTLLYHETDRSHHAHARENRTRSHGDCGTRHAGIAGVLQARGAVSQGQIRRGVIQRAGDTCKVKVDVHTHLR